MAKILLVDDDQFIRDIYQEVLTTAGHQVDIAIDGKQGLEKILEGGYDLILLDVMMPYLDGVGIITILEERKPKSKNGPIIFLTNLAYDSAVKELVTKKQIPCLNKSDMNPDEFLQKISTFLK